MDPDCSEDVFGPKRDSIYIVILLTIIYSVIFLIGSIGNISTCIVISKNKSMHTATNYYLFSLAISDQLLLLSGIPQEVYSFWSRYPYVFGEYFCFARGLLSETSGNSSVLIIGAFTVERYLAICHPFLSHTMSNLSRAVKLIVLIWLASIALAVPQAFPLRVELLNGTCALCVISSHVNVEPIFELSSIFLFVVPMSVIIVLYVLIGIKLKSSTVIGNGTSFRARMHKKSSWKVVKMLVAVVISFFVCWAPFHVQRLVAIYQNSNMKVYELITYISGILYYMSAIINPILYNIMSAKYRDAFKETFSWCLWKENRIESKLSYSGGSKYSNTKYPDSNDTGSQDNTMQSMLSMHHKNSLESTAINTLMKKIQIEEESDET